MGGQDWVTDFNPGYFKRGNHLFPKGFAFSMAQYTGLPAGPQLLAEGPPDDGVLQFQKPGKADAA